MLALLQIVTMIAFLPPEVAGAMTAFELVVMVLTALAVWLIARRRAWAFWLLILVAMPFYAILGAFLMTAMGGNAGVAGE